ncbi:fimbrial protein [Burkholderia stagnalis]|uniref:fimbrial protein n=1 Tax=Burkholderia stagnalis TaxID=1503054 RepID=UPI000B2B56A5|nr:fimbrial protein [Burkholderia stagnalis]
MIRIKNYLSARLPEMSPPEMATTWRTRLSGNTNAKSRRIMNLSRGPALLLTVCAFWPLTAQCVLTAFGQGRIAAPSNTATGSILARQYYTPQELCAKDVCEVTSASLYNKGSSWSTKPGPDIETTVDGLSARVLLDGVPMTDKVRQSVRSRVEVQLFRDSRTPKNGTLKPGFFNGYFTIRYKSGILGDLNIIDLAADVNFINGTCSVPNQTVNLPDASLTSFRGVGSTAGGRSFSLRLTNCPAGYNRVGYQVSPLNGPVSGIPGALQLRPDSTASGVGIKLSDAKTQLPLPFDRSIATPYNGSAAPQIDIPLNAEYVQTAEKITGGTVQAGALVLLDYQ